MNGYLYTPAYSFDTKAAPASVALYAKISVYSLRKIIMTRIILIMIMVITILTACGTKGPLYLPERQYPLPSETPK
jgi:predicted small lipoprotein YifL